MNTLPKFSDNDQLVIAASLLSSANAEVKSKGREALQSELVRLIDKALMPRNDGMRYLPNCYNQFNYLWNNAWTYEDAPDVIVLEVAHLRVELRALYEQKYRLK